MLKEVFDWWIGQMAALVPESLRRSMTASEEFLLVEPEFGRGGAGELGRFALEPASLQAAGELAPRGAVRLRLPADVLLEKQVTLPAAASRDIDRVLGYEMDRETPFAADEAWWDYEVEQRDRQQGRLVVRLSIIPKAAVESLLSALRGAGIAPGTIEVLRPDGTRRRIPLDAPQRHGLALGGRSLSLAAAGCGVLLLAALIVPFVRQAWSLHAVEAEMAALKPSVAEAEGLRRRLQQTGVTDVVEAERARLGDPLAVLAAATQLLPDDTHLTEFSMEQRRVTLNGQSPGAAKLIGTFAANPTFKDPAFAAPSTHLDSQHVDTFSIAAEARS